MLVWEPLRAVTLFVVIPGARHHQAGRAGRRAAGRRGDRVIESTNAECHVRDRAAFSCERTSDAPALRFYSLLREMTVNQIVV